MDGQTDVDHANHRFFRLSSLIAGTPSLPFGFTPEEAQLESYIRFLQIPPLTGRHRLRRWRPIREDAFKVVASSHSVVVPLA